MLTRMSAVAGIYKKLSKIWIRRFASMASTAARRRTGGGSSMKRASGVICAMSIETTIGGITVEV
jgi:hypothetical protein